ncbi:hypothetical protein BCIN_14g03720 [Botrytis cinerea B05.10]|uniref:Uncharacterized protein n=1 Tax=Botryotinia fuckeliana (strain B05.10) TaxID=332648 RepID=A0A384K324_BOTFB|nr:hypothetical protein BCIN_14g03720 [Botrytis cinerea B05.10]ATZ57213.1 hypothetical protein BCIN_14g03720 [Botrytis cinerea B05.10]
MTTISQTEQTINGDYKYISGNHTFKAVNYCRFISWMEGGGKIIIRGVNTITRKILTNSNEANITLDAWDEIEVENTNFRLARASND